MTAWLLTWLWQGSALAGGVAVALACVPRLNAATRHLIWWGSFAALAWIGWASSPHTQATALRGCATGTAQLATSTAQIAAGGTGLQPCPATEPLLYVPSAPDIFITIFFGVWAAIALVSLLRLLPGLHRVYALRNRCEPFPTGVESRLPLWLEARSRGRGTQLMICDAVAGATVLGFERPCIAIPSSLVEALTIDELDQVILHEHAHVQRRDDWSRLAQTLLFPVLCVHPAALFVSRALSREREMACDEWVVARTGQPKAYARCLTRAAELRLQRRPVPSLVPALLGGRHELVRRVDRLLAMRAQPARTISLGAAGVAVCAMMVMSTQLTSVRFAEIAEIVLPHVVQASTWTNAPMLDSPGGLFLALAGPHPRSLSLGGASSTRFPPAPRSGRRRSAPNASTFAPTLHIASADKPSAPDAPSLSARVFTGAYSDASTFAPTAQIASVDRPDAPNAPLAPLASLAPSIASTAKATSLGVARAFTRAGVSLARSF